MQTSDAMIKHRTLATIAAALVCCIAFSGCSVVMALRQPDKRNLQVLSAGASRDNVITYLGAPISSETKDGQRVDIFQFKQGYRKGVKASRALFYGVADVFTLFIWELIGMPAEVIMNGSDMTIKVIYDDKDTVKDVIYLKKE